MEKASSRKKLSNSIGLIGYGPDFEKSIFMASVGSAILLRIQGKEVIVTSKPLLRSIPDEHTPKFLFKLINSDEEIKKLIVGAPKDSFKFHPEDRTENSLGLAYVVLENELANFEIFELQLDHQFPSIFDTERINITTIDKENISYDQVHSDQEVLKQKSFQGKNFNHHQKINVDDLNLTLHNQKTVEFATDVLPESIYQGGLIYKQNNNSIKPIGIITTFGKGKSRQYFEGQRKQIDFCTYLHFSELLKAICHHNNLSVNQKYQSPSAFYLDNVHKIRNAIERITDDILTRKIIEIENDADSQNDEIRSKWLSALKQEFLSARFNLFLIEQSLMNLDWWEISHRNNPPNRKTQESLINAYHTTIFRGFIISIFSVIEHCLRQILRDINPDACNNARDNFHNILGYLFKRLNIEKKDQFETLFKLFRNIRNAIHNDGFHYSKNKGENTIIEYKNKTYKFVDENPIPINWEDLLIISEDAAEFLVVFLEDEFVREGV